jgi:hypothetical protein
MQEGVFIQPQQAGTAADHSDTGKGSGGMVLGGGIHQRQQRRHHYGTTMAPEWPLDVKWPSAVDAEAAGPGDTQRVNTVDTE